MKRNIILIALFFCVNGLFAQHVTEEQALQKAQAFLQDKVMNSANGRRGAPAKAPAMQRVTQAAPTNAYYIFNAEQNGGFVIVSGDERAEEILGYSTEGHIDPQQMPENMRAWLKGYEAQINAISASATTTSSSMPKHPAVKPMLTTQWDQGAPYNLQCPTMIPDGETEPQHCVTGCVATAMAQIMYYWKWPQDYTTTIPAHGYGYEGWDSQTQTAIYKYHTKELPRVKFDWASMKNTYSGSETDASADAVAQLMRYCGQSVCMDYGLWGSGASQSPQALINYFGYDNGAVYVDQYSHYSIREWDALIYREIEEGRPIWYSGSAGGGHSFVCDGYDGDGAYHFNWGWGGYQDGYFKLNVHSSSDYLTGQSAVIGIQKPTGGNNSNYVFYTYAYLTDNSEIEGIFVNNSNRDGIFDGGIMIEGTDGTTYSSVKTLFTNQTIQANRSIYRWTYISSLNLPDGNYRLWVVMKESSESEWHKSHSYRKNRSYFGITVKGGVVTSSFEGPIADLEGTIQPRGCLVTGENLKLDATFVNHGDEYNRPVYLFVSQTANMGSAMARNSLAVEENSQETIYFDYTFQQAGTYHIWIATGTNPNDEGFMILAQTDITVCDPININMSGGAMDWSTMKMSITVTNNDNIAYNQRVAVRIYPREDREKEGAGQVFKSKKLTIKPGKSATVEISCAGLSIDNLYDYYLMCCKDPNSAVLSNYQYWYRKLEPASKGSFYVDGIKYSIVDTENHYVMADYYYFSGTSELTVPAKVVSPDDGISYKVKGIDNSFCYNSDISSLTFSEGITTIESYALWDCQSLETIVLPASLRAMGESPIARCTNLKTIFSKATEAPTSADGSMFYWENRETLYDQVTLYVPKGYQDTYANHTAWSQFSKIVEVDPDIALKKGVYLDKSKAVVRKKKTLTLKASVYPVTLTDKSVKWKSSDKTVATVSSSGKVTGVKSGVVTITCTSVATGAKATCKVTVGTITLDKSEVVVRKKKSVTLTPTVYPTSLEDKSVKWKSSDKTIATVSSSGKVTGVKSGVVTITCTSNATGLSATCKVTVGTITLDKSEVIVKKKNTVTLTPTVYPTSLEDKSVTWKSSDKTVATVSADGVVKGVKSGVVTITCTSNATGLSATCKVTVATIALNKSEVIVKKKNTVTLTPTVYPTSLEDKSVTWKSSDESIATVSSDGVVTGVKSGFVTITCTSNATGVSTTCEVTVGTISLSKSSATLTIGEKVTLTPTVYPTALEDKSVTWKSSNKAVAKVSSTGKVTAIAAGTATITCTSVATGLSTTCKVTVKAASARTIDGEDAELTDIEIVEVTPAIEEPFDVYDLRGHKVRQGVTSLDGLPAGVYIVKGKKVLKK